MILVAPAEPSHRLPSMRVWPMLVVEREGGAIPRVLDEVRVPDSNLADWVASLEERAAAGRAATAPAATAHVATDLDAPSAATPVRWVFTATRDVYLEWFNRGISVERAHDLRYTTNILKHTAYAPASARENVEAAWAALAHDFAPIPPGASHYAPGNRYAPGSRSNSGNRSARGSYANQLHGGPLSHGFHPDGDAPAALFDLPVSTASARLPHQNRESSRISPVGAEPSGAEPSGSTSRPDPAVSPQHQRPAVSPQHQHAAVSPQHQRPAVSHPQLAAMFALLDAQLGALAQASKPAHLQLSLSAESVGALVAVEMEAQGIPWSASTHNALLEAQLGERPAPGQRPAKLAERAAQIAQLLGVAPFNVDSSQELLRALHRAGIEATSTRKHELRRFTHPAIGPLIEYKKLSRLMSANGWNWLDEWVRDGRFHPEYVVAGAPTGRWASSGGGAMQIPHNVRDAVVAEPGWAFVVADAAQLEPRVLAAMSRDAGLAAAGQGQDLYQGTADQVFSGDRAKAKVAILGAIYGATTGASAQLKPTLVRNYPRALALVEEAAREGERGGSVHTFLGRTSEPVDSRFFRALAAENPAAARAGASMARARGRFTRNFVVQGTAAEWAECWMGELRRRLRAMGATGAGCEAPQLVSFLHDEVVIHTPLNQAAEVERHVAEAARLAAVIVFGANPVEFPISVATVSRYSDAKD